METSFTTCVSLFTLAIIIVSLFSPVKFAFFVRRSIPNSAYVVYPVMAALCTSGFTKIFSSSSTGCSIFSSFEEICPYTYRIPTNSSKISISRINRNFLFPRFGFDMISPLLNHQYAFLLTNPLKIVRNNILISSPTVQFSI